MHFQELYMGRVFALLTVVHVITLVVCALSAEVPFRISNNMLVNPAHLRLAVHALAAALYLGLFCAAGRVAQYMDTLHFDPSTVTASAGVGAVNVLSLMGALGVMDVHVWTITTVAWVGLWHLVFRIERGAAGAGTVAILYDTTVVFLLLSTFWGAVIQLAAPRDRPMLVVLVAISYAPALMLTLRLATIGDPSPGHHDMSEEEADMEDLEGRLRKSTLERRQVTMYSAQAHILHACIHLGTSAYGMWLP